MIISPSGKMIRDLKFQRCSGTKLILLLIFYFLLNLCDCKNILDLNKVREACDFTKLGWKVLRFLILLLYTFLKYGLGSMGKQRQVTVEISTSVSDANAY